MKPWRNYNNRRRTYLFAYLLNYCSALRPSKGRYTLVTLQRTVTPYRDSVDGTSGRVTDQSWLRGNVTDLFGVLSLFGCHIKGMIRLRPEQVWTCNVKLNVHSCSGFSNTILKGAVDGALPCLKSFSMRNASVNCHWIFTFQFEHCNVVFIKLF
jgi:hypothetical protein